MVILALELILAAGMVIGRAGTQGQTLEEFPACVSSPVASTREWQRVSFEGMSFLLPREFETRRTNRVFDHGGREWGHRDRVVTAAVGFWGPSSFSGAAAAAGMALCRAEAANGRQVLLMERMSGRDVSVQVWHPGLRSILMATSRETKDLPILRAIVLSATPGEP